MACCGDKHENIPFVVEIFNYLKMGKYIPKLMNGTTTHEGYTFQWRKCTQEQLAFAYEELGLKKFVTKQNNEKTNSKKTKKSSKSSEKQG